MEFESRNLIRNKVLKAIRDDSSSMISVCGQGGVGKTKNVERIVQIVEGEKLVDEIALAVVSRNLDVKRILGDIASCLRIDYQDKNEQELAHKLHERIIEKSDKKLLLILDDVWTEIDFQRLRIPPAGKRAGYKILLTSRREDECRKMGTLNFRVDALPIEEGWDLFKAIAFGENFIDNQDKLSQLAKKISDECDGLPIAIATIAKALKGRDIRIWADTLNQLQSSNLEGISGMDRVYFSIQLSYKLLQREEAKACFLLCCLFPEDYSIPVEDLMRCAVGLRLLHNTETILQARNRVCTLVGELKESFLLLDGKKYDGEYVKMHDVVRDVAISIASRDKSYLVCCDNMMSRWPIKWLDRYTDCTAISVFSEEIKEHVTDVECPQLQLLQLQSRGSLPDNFFEGMKELKVIYFNGCFPPKSLNVIKNVRTLHLSHVTKTSTFEDLQNVEILKIGRWQELPNGVGLMKNLRLLDLRDATSLKYIPAGVLSRLSKLEELYVSLEFVRWESTVDGEKMNASLMELESTITTLEICVSDISRLI